MTHLKLASVSTSVRLRVLPCLAATGWLLGGCAGWSAAQLPPQPSELGVVHRSGQTFVTWTERSDLAGERYRVYRHSEPITSANLASARRLLEVWEGSGRFLADRWDDNGTWHARYLERFVIADNQPQLAAGTGLLVWTLATSDLGGASSGQGYYAVTTVSPGGVENISSFGAGNTAGPVAESVADPLPVEASVPGNEGGHIFVQYYDLHTFNPTFYAPHPRNGFFGLSEADPAVAHALQYALTYSVGEPSAANCGGTVPARVPVVLYLHGWNGNTYPPQLGPSEYYCAFEIRPIDVSETWYFGFARSHDFRTGEEPAAGDTVVNYTEQRLLRSVYDLLRHPVLGPRADANRIYVYGHSMGGSGTLALALRYPNVFAAAYASEPMTDYRTSGDGGDADWREDVAWKWGSRTLNLPVSLGGPGNWAAHLTRYNGVGVWDWQNHQANIASRTADETVPIGVGHGRQDQVIGWTTQGRPFPAQAEAGRRCWGGWHANADHTWLGFAGLPPTLSPDASTAPFAGLAAVRNESVPGLSRASGNLPLPPPDEGAEGGFNQFVEWSASWNAWDGAPVDTASLWGISLRTVDGQPRTVDVTPRRLQTFRIVAGGDYAWENRRVSDDGLVASGHVTADAAGLVTVPSFAVTGTGNRLRLRPSGGPPANQPPVARLAVTPASGTAPLTVICNGAASSDPDGTISAHVWSFGDGSTGSGVQTNHTYTSPGVFTVTLTVTDDRGAQGSANATVTVTAAGTRPRPWRDTTRGVHVFNDQLPPNMSPALLRFCVTHYDGTQKMLRSDADALRALDPSFLILHYRLGHALGYRAADASCQPTGDWLGIIEGNAWVREWPGDSVVVESWLAHHPETGGQRVYNCDWGWYLAAVHDPGFQAFWRGEILRQLAANDADGLFMDSLSVPNYLGHDHYRPVLPAVDEAFETTWAQRIAAWLAWLKGQLAGQAWIVPNVGAWNTSRETTDYSAADGLMVEGFAMDGNASPYAADDWGLQLDRVLGFTRAGKTLLAQTYVDGAQERLFTLGSYLLVKGSRTYLNFETSDAPDWWPEYDVPIGAPLAPPAASIEALRSSVPGVYTRAFDNGSVWVNPAPSWDGGQVRTVTFPSPRYLAEFSGGGEVTPNGETTARVTYRQVSQVTLQPASAAVVLDTLPKVHVPRRHLGRAGGS
ncbi:MAG TPA: putative glycoside hydrolase [Thermoanaerobaculaceae bacterium]|nr:putative glycoside hydrolase [Thermoanaerobaculaceae bacterium]HRS14919.1 putative glycoside hydrolase [Thermoanaerobaculaceae bacterium]